MAMYIVAQRATSSCFAWLLGLLCLYCAAMMISGRRTAAGGWPPPPEATNPASISGQSMPWGWAPPGLVEHQEPGVAVKLLERLDPGANRDSSGEGNRALIDDRTTGILTGSQPRPFTIRVDGDGMVSDGRQRA